MDKSGCFLHNPGVIGSVLQAALNGGLKEATRIGANHGVMVAAIVLDGKLHLDAQAFSGDVAKENDPNRKWDDDPKVGINYVGYATGKVMQSIRTNNFSKEGSALGYGESDSAGSYNEICFCRNSDGDEIKFQLITAYSGMSPDEDFSIAHTACRSGWFVMSGQKNSDGSDIHLCRIVGNCGC